MIHIIYSIRKKKQNENHYYIFICRSGGSGRILPGADGGWSSGGSGAGPMQPQQKEWSSGKLQ